MKRHLHLGIALTLATILLTGCGSQSVVSVVKDIPLSQVDVALALSPRYSNPNYGYLQIHADFFTSKNNPMDTPIFFSGDQTMTCNGHKLTRSTPAQTALGENPAFTGQLSPDVASKSISCVFSASGVQIPITYQFPSSITIISPKDGATVKRSKDFTIVYQPIKAPNSTVSVMANIIDLDDNHIPFYAGGGSRVHSTLQAQTGTCHVDISHANTGNSAVIMLSEVTTHLTTSQFHSLTITYIDNSDILPGDSINVHVHIT